LEHVVVLCIGSIWVSWQIVAADWTVVMVFKPLFETCFVKGVAARQLAGRFYLFVLHLLQTDVAVGVVFSIFLLFTGRQAVNVGLGYARRLRLPIMLDDKEAVSLPWPEHSEHGVLEFLKTCLLDLRLRLQTLACRELLSAHTLEANRAEHALEEALGLWLALWLTLGLLQVHK